jgi:hypothetical protein
VQLDEHVPARWLQNSLSLAEQNIDPVRARRFWFVMKFRFVLFLTPPLSLASSIAICS